MELSFPPGPTNGQLFEIAPGQLYQYSSFYRSWQRIVRPVIPLATPISNGLMSKEDYQKLTNILIPPPISNLSSEGCDPVKIGYVGVEGDDYLSVTVDPENVHENTGLVQFSLDYDKLIRYLIEQGKVRYITQQGDQGPQGEQGDPGLDSLPVGPYGEDGPDGVNAVWPGALVQDNLGVKEDNRAIVDVTTQEVSESENYLVVTRANLGNPDACPDTIKPQDRQSPWLLAIAPGGVVTRKVKTDDGKLVCSSACGSTLHYLNIETIVQSIRKQFVTYLDEQKKIKETYVRSQLDVITSTFEEQKQAIACALERCMSKTRNQQARQYLEQSKIAAAQADAAKPGYKISVARPQEAGRVPEWFDKCGYNQVDIQDPDSPIIDPDGLDTGPQQG